MCSKTKTGPRIKKMGTKKRKTVAEIIAYYPETEYYIMVKH